MSLKCGSVYAAIEESKRTTREMGVCSQVKSENCTKGREPEEGEPHCQGWKHLETSTSYLKNWGLELSSRKGTGIRPGELSVQGTGGRRDRQEWPVSSNHCQAQLSAYHLATLPGISEDFSPFTLAYFPQREMPAYLAWRASVSRLLASVLLNHPYVNIHNRRECTGQQ